MGRLATPEGTRRYAEGQEAAPGHYREALGLTLSSIGFGSYLGAETDAADEAYGAAFAAGLLHGVNVLDTAGNYRARRSERAIGAAIRRSQVPREAFLLATKGGFVPFDAAGGEPPHRYFERSYVEPGVCDPADLVAGCHVMTPRYLAHELNRSLECLDVEGVDVYFLHNPETQLAGGVPRRAFEDRLRESFALLERKRREGKIGVYGLATWTGLRVPPEHPQHLPLARILEIASEVGGRTHGLRALELPHNLALPEAATAPTQAWGGRRVPVLEAAREAGLLVLASASLFQARLLGRIAPDLPARLGVAGDAHAALQFARSTPGVTSALVGTGDPAHAQENAALRRTPPAPEAVRALLA